MCGFGVVCWREFLGDCRVWRWGDLFMCRLVGVVREVRWDFKLV